MKQNVNKLENDRRSLQEELGKNEARATKLELQRMSLEGDLQRLQMILQEKDANIQVMIILKLTLHCLKSRSREGRLGEPPPPRFKKPSLKFENFYIRYIKHLRPFNFLNKYKLPLSDIFRFFFFLFLRLFLPTKFLSWIYFDDIQK